MAASGGGKQDPDLLARRLSRSASSIGYLQRFTPPGKPVPLRFVRTISIDRGHKVVCPDSFTATDVMRSAVARGKFDKRQGSGYRRWYERHFALLPMSSLLYYIGPEDKEAYGCVLLGPNASAKIVENEKESKFELHVCPWPQHDPDKIVVLGYQTRTYAELWRDAIQVCRYHYIETYLISYQKSMERLSGFYTSVEGLAHARKQYIEILRDEKDAAVAECERLKGELRRRDAATVEMQRYIGACLKAERLLRQSIARSLDHKEVQRVESEWKKSREPGWRSDRERMREVLASAAARGSVYVGPSSGAGAASEHLPPAAATGAGSVAPGTFLPASARSPGASSGSASTEVDCRAIPPAWRVDGADELDEPSASFGASHGSAPKVKLSRAAEESSGAAGGFVYQYVAEHTVLDTAAAGEAVSALAARLDYASALGRRSREAFAQMVHATLTVKEKYNQVLFSLQQERKKSRSRSRSSSRLGMGGGGGGWSVPTTRGDTGRRKSLASPVGRPKGLSGPKGSLPTVTPFKRERGRSGSLSAAGGGGFVGSQALYADSVPSASTPTGSIYRSGSELSLASGRVRTSSIASVGSSIGVRDAEVFSDTESEDEEEGGNPSMGGEAGGKGEDQILKERDEAVKRAIEAAGTARPPTRLGTIVSASTAQPPAPIPGRPLRPADPHPCRLWVLAMTARHLPRTDFRSVTGGLCRAWLRIRAFGHITEGEKVQAAELGASKGVAAVFRSQVAARRRTRGVLPDLPDAAGSGAAGGEGGKTDTVAGLQVFWLRVTDHLDVAGSIVHVDVLREGMRLFGTDAHVGTAAVDVSCLESWTGYPHAVWCQLHKPLRWDVDKKQAAIQAAMAAATAAESGKKASGPLRDDNGDPLPSRRERLLPVGGPAAKRAMPTIGQVQQSASNLLEQEGEERPPVIFRREDSLQQRFAASELPPPPLDTRPKILLQFAYTTSPGALPKFFDPAEAARQATDREQAAARARAAAAGAPGEAAAGGGGGGVLRAATGVTAPERPRGFSVTSLPPPAMDEAVLRAAASVEGSGAAANAAQIASDAGVPPLASEASAESLVGGAAYYADERDGEGEAPPGATPVSAGSMSRSVGAPEASSADQSNAGGKESTVAGDLSDRDKLYVLRREYKKLYRRHKDLRSKAVKMRDTLVKVAAARHHHHHHRKASAAKERPEEDTDNESEYAEDSNDVSSAQAGTGD